MKSFKKIKVNFKMPKESPAERLAREHAARRKASGLPDPSHYKDLAAQKQKEIDAMKNEETDKHERFKKYIRPVIKTTPKIEKTTEPSGRATDHTEWKVTGPTGEIKRFKTKKEAHAHYNSFSEEIEVLDEMPESSMKVRDVHAHLKKSGWALARSSGGHDIYKHPQAKHHIPVPRHKQLKAPLIRGIMKASKVTEEAEIEEQLEKKGRFVSGPIKQPFKSNTLVTSVKEDKDGTISVIKKGTNVKQKISAGSYDVFKKHGFRKEDVELDEAIKIGSKVTIHAPGKDYHGQTGHVGEIRNGAFKGAPKTYTVDHSGGSTQLSQKNVKLHKEDVELDEGRQSQRHPLEGHEYHKKSNDALVHIAKDAHAAAEAMKGHNTQAENKYRDQANDSATVRYFRQRHGMPDWYKKKYGHVKEGSDPWKDKHFGKGVATNRPMTPEEKANHQKSLEKDRRIDALMQKSSDEYDSKQKAHRNQNLSSMRREDVEQIDEISTATKTSYRQKAIADIRALRPHAEKGEYKDLAKNVMQKRKAGVNRSMKEDKDPCWKDYEMVGMKKKNGKPVPNCVPVKEANEPTTQVAPQDPIMDKGKPMSRKAEIVRSAAKGAKATKDKFFDNPELSGTIEKN